MSLVKSLVRPLVLPLLRPLTGLSQGILDAIAALGNCWPFKSKTLKGKEGNDTVYTRASAVLFENEFGKLQEYAVNDPAYNNGLGVYRTMENKIQAFNFAPDAAISGVADGTDMTTTRVIPDAFPPQCSDLNITNGYVFNHETVSSSNRSFDYFYGGGAGITSTKILCRVISGNWQIANKNGTNPFENIPDDGQWHLVRFENDNVTAGAAGIRIRGNNGGSGTAQLQTLGAQAIKHPIALKPFIETQGSAVTKAQSLPLTPTTGIPTSDVSVYIRLTSDGRNGADQYLWQSGTNAVWFDESALEFVASASGFETRVAVTDITECGAGAIWCVDSSNNLTLKICGEESTPVALGGAVTWGSDVAIGRTTGNSNYGDGRYSSLAWFNGTDVTPEDAQWVC